MIWRATSEEASLPARQARCLTGTSKPLLKVLSWDAPDTTDSYRRYAGRVCIVHCAEPAQDGRWMDAEPPRDLICREELLIGGIAVEARLGRCHCGSCVVCFTSVTCSDPFCLRSLQCQDPVLAPEDPKRSIEERAVRRLIQPA